MIRLSDGSLFDDQAAEAAYFRAQRAGLIRHHAPALEGGPTRSLEGLKPKSTPGLAGLLFGRARRK